MAKRQKWTKWTPRREAKFIAALAEIGNVGEACTRAGVSRSAAYKRKSKRMLFSAAWDEALETACDALELEARRRAYAGTEEPVYYQGVECGSIQRYSDSLMMFLLKAHRPEKYRERFEHSGPGGRPLMPATVIVLPDNGREDRAPAGEAAPVSK